MECGRSNCCVGIWSIRMDTCLSEFVLTSRVDVHSYIYITTGVMCDPSTFSSLGTSRDSIWPLRMVPWGKCIPNSRFCASTFFFDFPSISSN